MTFDASMNARVILSNRQDLRPLRRALDEGVRSEMTCEASMKSVLARSGVDWLGEFSL